VESGGSPAGALRFVPCFYMATLVAVRYNPVLLDFYQRLRSAGKTPKVAVTACLRKLFVILNAIVKSQKPWSLEPIQR